MKQIQQGAEATIYQDKDKITKLRTSKSYRLPILDNKLRKSRTKAEAKIINKLQSIIPVPKILETDNQQTIEMEFIDGKKLSKHLEQLDFEFEIAVLISNGGKNIAWKNAHNHIGGLMIMNDWSAREIQFKEMKLNLGPAKGKDFATSLGPCIVTLDELSDNIIKTDNGNHYSLNMECFINNEKISEDNLENISWTFGQIIERISMGTTIYPGDVIGSGTCATGCFLELNQIDNERWLKRNDIIDLRVEKLGSLKNKII